jgi:hypothetical protein
MTPTECPPLVISEHPMLLALERLYKDVTTRAAVIQGIEQGGTPGLRLTRIEQTGLMDDYDDPGKDRARQQLLGGLWGTNETLIAISSAVKEAFECADSKGMPLRARWIAGLTVVEILPLVVLGEEAVYLILLAPRLKASPVMEKAAYDPKLLEHLRKNADEVVAFLDSI